MNWFSENKGFTAFLVIVLLLSLGIGFFLFQERAQYSEISEEFDAQAEELHRLQTLPVYPSQENLEALERQRDQYEKAVNQLRVNLNKREFPVEEISANAFQDELRAVVSEVQEAAKKNEVKLPENFYLGFGRYQTELPAPEAAPLLARQLAAVRDVVLIMIEEGISELVSINRVSLAEEAGAGEEEEGEDQGEEQEKKQLVSRFPVDYVFIADPTNAREILNSITRDDNFYILRWLKVANLQPEGPDRGVSAAAPGAPAQQRSDVDSPLFFSGGVPEEEEAPAAGGDEEEAGRLEFIVGTEKIEVTTRIEQIDFVAPEPEEDAGEAPAETAAEQPPES